MAHDFTTNKEYLPIEGLPLFVNSALKLLYGESCEDIDRGLIQGVQSISGTGANRLSIELLYKYHNVSNFYCPDPTWPIHLSILEYLGAKNIHKYKYYDASSESIPMDQLLCTLKAAPERSAVILHGCGHNPTGMDFSKEEWKLLADVIIERKLIPILDIAYLGFVSGSIDEDAYSVRLFHSMGIESLVCVSFAKNMGLYNERIGLLAFYGKSKEIVDQVKNRLVYIIRNSYSNPPNHGAQIASRILNTPSLKEEWNVNLLQMVTRIDTMRRRLHELLNSLDPTRNWSFIIKQRGLFSYTPLTEKNVAHMEKVHHIYMLKTGRINICGLTEHNIMYVSKAMVETINNKAL